MDVTVTKVEGQQEWTLTDLLGRSMGRIVRDGPEDFSIVPEGKALETMREMKQGPYPSLNAALAQIETHTRGVCRLGEGEQ